MTALRIAAALLASLLAAPAYAQVENKDFQRLQPPQAPATPGKVEVLEFFSYGCPHCDALHPRLKKWVAQLPANTAFVRVPVSFGRREWGILSRTYYALESTGDLARLDDAIFHAIHHERQPLGDAESITLWMAKHGVDAGKFRAALESSAVSAKALRAEQMSRDYKVSGVPYLIIDGRYVVLGDSYDAMLQNARALIDKAAAERKAPKSKEG